MQTSESIAGIAKALAAFQSEVKQPEKSADNPFFKSKYVPLESVVEAINTYGPKHGLSFTQWPHVNEQGRVGVSTLLMHASGEWIQYDPVFMKAEKETAQAAGSVVSYLRRYALSAIFGITSDEDDDGNVATHSQKAPQKAPQRPKTPPKQPSNGITPEQMKALGEAVKKVSGLSGIEAPRVYENAAESAGVKGKQSKQLTKDEADKVIQFLGEFSG